jgi:hypothetical protein
MNRWTENAVAILQQRWSAGLTAGEIAAELGLSRNAVISKADRLGLARHQTRPSAVWATRRRLGALADNC